MNDDFRTSAAPTNNMTAPNATTAMASQGASPTFDRSNTQTSVYKPPSMANNSGTYGYTTQPSAQQPNQSYANPLGNSQPKDYSMMGQAKWADAEKERRKKQKEAQTQPTAQIGAGTNDELQNLVSKQLNDLLGRAPQPNTGAVGTGSLSDNNTSAYGPNIQTLVHYPQVETPQTNNSLYGAPQPYSTGQTPTTDPASPTETIKPYSSPFESYTANPNVTSEGRAYGNELSW